MKAHHHPQGRPTPENSAGANRAGGGCVTDHSCDERDEGHADDGDKSTRDGACDSPAPPWVRNTATGRRSRRPRARNETFARRFAEEQAEALIAAIRLMERVGATPSAIRSGLWMPGPKAQG